jgi:hypothetical protein
MLDVIAASIAEADASEEQAYRRPRPRGSTGSGVWRARFVLPADRPPAYRWDAPATRSLAISPAICASPVSPATARRRGRPRPRAVRAQRPVGAPAGRARAAALRADAPWRRPSLSDEVTKGHALRHDWSEQVPADPSRADLADLRHHLRERFLQPRRTSLSLPRACRRSCRGTITTSATVGGDGADRSDDLDVYQAIAVMIGAEVDAQIEAVRHPKAGDGASKAALDPSRGDLSRQARPLCCHSPEDECCAAASRWPSFSFTSSV